MGNKLRAYISSLYEFIENEEDAGDLEHFKLELIREIQFWQHERLVHLIVTFLFAVATLSVLLVLVFCASLALLILFIMLLVLLVPYIKHYFILENGVQTLYVIYEEISRRNNEKGNSLRCIPEQYGIRIKDFDTKKKVKKPDKEKSK